MITTSLIVCVIGGLVYVLLGGSTPPPEGNSNLVRIAELGKWAFIVGLAAVLFFLK